MLDLLRYPALAAVLVGALVAPALATDIERRVSFARGTSGTVITGTVDPAKSPSMGEVRDRYIVRAKKGQTLLVKLQATSKVGLFVWQHDYNDEPTINEQGTAVTKSAKLKATGDYHIDVDVLDKAAKYKLTIEIH